MNLLIYVTALLLSLSALSYQAFARFKNDHYLRKQWDIFLHQEALCGFNRAVEEAYENNRISRKQTSSTRAEENFEATGKMNFRYFASIEKSSANPVFAEQYSTLGKRLLHLLYAKQAFFHDALEKNSTLLDELFNAIKELNKTAKIKKVKNLSELPLEGDMREFWISLCKECAMEVPVLKAFENKNECRKRSFLEFLSDKDADKIRVFLASPLLLIAIYEDLELVKEIIKERKRLLKQRNDTKDNEQASKEFQSLFSGRSNFEQLLDFSVTGSQPNK